MGFGEATLTAAGLALICKKVDADHCGLKS